MKSIPKAYFALLVSAIVLFASGSVPAQQKEEAKIRQAVTAVNEDLMKAFASGNGNGIASFEAKNDQLLQPNGKPISG